MQHLMRSRILVWLTTLLGTLGHESGLCAWEAHNARWAGYLEDSSLLQRSSRRVQLQPPRPHKPAAALPEDAIPTLPWSRYAGTPAPTPGPQALPAALQMPPAVLQPPPEPQRANGTEQGWCSAWPLLRLRSLLYGVRETATEFARKAKGIVQQGREHTAQILVMVIFSIVVQALLGTLVAHTYMEMVRVQPEVEESKRGADLSHWSSSLLMDFVRDAKICFFSCLCPCVRWADSMHTLGIMSFWAAYWLSMACIVMTELTEGIFWWLVLIGLVYFRHWLRRKFKMDSNSLTYGADFVRFCLCLPCTLAQDARHIEDACRADHPAVLHGLLLHYES